MKKKLLILAGVVMVLAAVGKIVLAEAAMDQQVSESWLLPDAVEKIEITGIPQNVSVDIQQTEAVETTVTVAGQVSEKVQQRLQQAEVVDNSLKLQLDAGGFVTATVVLKEEPLKITILLGKETNFQEISMDSLAAVELSVPAAFQGKYQLKARGDGQVLAVPTTTEAEASIIKIDAVGDITVKK